MTAAKKTFAILSFVALTAVVATGTYFLVDFLMRDKSNNFQAVVINDDKTFAKSIEYDAYIIPGGTAEQDIKVQSRLQQKVVYKFNFSTDEVNDYSMLNVKIKIGDDEIENKALSQVLQENKDYTYTIGSFQESLIHIDYSLSFDYMGDINSWNFKINFKAEGVIW